MDSLPLLTHRTERLQRVARGGGGVAEVARQIIEAAEERKRYIAGYYREQVRLNLFMRAVFDREAPHLDW